MREQRKKLLLIVMLAVLIVIGSFYSFWRKSAVPETISTETVTKTDSPRKEPATDLVVYISGAVNKPGVFKMPSGARVFDVVAMAGGLAPEADTAKVNLAQSVKDGMHIHIEGKVLPVSGERPAIAGTARGKENNTVNINYADKSQLDTLPGVGPALAERIIEYRQANGGFKDVDELRNVPGIGASKFEKLKEKISI